MYLRARILEHLSFLNLSYLNCLNEFQGKALVPT
nr:MAG TPA: hypothetical protein [Caudoviricetes sp.]